MQQKSNHIFLNRALQNMSASLKHLYRVSWNFYLLERDSFVSTMWLLSGLDLFSKLVGHDSSFLTQSHKSVFFVQQNSVAARVGEGFSLISIIESDFFYFVEMHSFMALETYSKQSTLRHTQKYLHCKLYGPPYGCQRQHKSLICTKNFSIYVLQYVLID